MESLNNIVPFPGEKRHPELSTENTHSYPEGQPIDLPAPQTYEEFIDRAKNELGPLGLPLDEIESIAREEYALAENRRRQLATTAIGDNVVSIFDFKRTR